MTDQTGTPQPQNGAPGVVPTVWDSGWAPDYHLTGGSVTPLVSWLNLPTTALDDERPDCPASRAPWYDESLAPEGEGRDA